MNDTLITGATSGIGLALAEEFARHGHSLILVGRDKAKLNSVTQKLNSIFPDISILPLVQDLSALDSGEKLFQQVQQHQRTVDILVNNAGIGFVGKYEDISMEKETSMMLTNMVTVASLCKYFIPMLKQQHGAILNVASNGAFHPGPYTANYYATKAYVLHLSQALRLELKPDQVQVSTLCPGATVSDFCRKAGKAQIKGSMSAAHVARIAYRQFMHHKAVIIPGFQNHLSMLAPRALRSRIVGFTQKRLCEKK